MNNIQYILKQNIRMDIEPARPEAAAEILQFLQATCGETEYLVSLPEDFDMSVERERDYLEAQAASADSITLCGMMDRRVMALGSLNTPARKRIAHTTELSVMVAKNCWGLGAGRAIMEELLRFAIASPTLRYVKLEVRADNERAIALYGSLGFKVMGRQKDFMCVGGRYHDGLAMLLELGD